MASKSGRTWADLAREILRGKLKLNLVKVFLLLSIGYFVFEFSPLSQSENPSTVKIKISEIFKMISEKDIRTWIFNGRLDNNVDADTLKKSHSDSSILNKDSETMAPSIKKSSPSNPSEKHSDYTVVNYARKADRSIVEQVITDLGFTHEQGPIISETRPVNSIWYDQKTVESEIVKELAKGLVNEELKIYLIRPFEHSDKPRTLEVGSDDDIKNNKINCHHYWTQEDIEKNTSFNRLNNGCPN